MRLLPIALLLGLAGCETPSKTLVLLHTTDEHSHLIGDGPELDDVPPAGAGSGINGGVGRRATLLAQERARAAALGVPTLTVSSGDNLMGTLTQIAAPLTGVDYMAMKQLAYDVTTIGNHEFDYGPDPLASAITAAMGSGGMPPALASNIHFNGAAKLEALYDATGTDATKPIHKSLILTTSNGLKVGFIGVVGADGASKATEKTPITFSVAASGMDSDVDGVIAQMATEVQPIIDDLRNKSHVDLVVLLSHAGMDTDVSISEDYKIVQSVTGIDVIISGHTHIVVDPQLIINKKTGHAVIVQGAGKFGEHLGRLTLKVSSDGVTMDRANTTLLDVNDAVVSDPAYNPLVSGAIDAVEKTKLAGASTSFLEQTLSEILSPKKIVDDAGKVGDLFFYPVTSTDFDVVGLALHKETPLEVLIADADLAAGDKYSSGHNDAAVVAAGAVRADINKGKTGVVSFADIYRIVPLGKSPANQTAGYPLTRFAVLAVELKSALEVTAGYSYLTKNNADDFLVPAGMQFSFDTGRTIFDPASAVNPMNGRVTKIVMASDHSKPDVFDKTLFDITNGNMGYTGSFTAPMIVVTNLYVARFAYLAGVTLKDPVTLAAFSSPSDAILKRADGSEVKEWEAVSEYLQAQGAKIPDRYNTTTPRRALCSGPLCAP